MHDCLFKEIFMLGKPGVTDMVPSTGAFFHFYGTKGVDKGSWVSISAHAGKSLFPSYASNFKKN